MDKSALKFFVPLLLCALLASTQAGEVMIYTGQVGWIAKADADAQAQICVNKLTAWGIPSTWYYDAATAAADKVAIATWMTAKTNNGQTDVLILYGVFPETIYPPPNAQPNGSIAELFIESNDGDMIINHGDAMFYVTGAGSNNGYAGLQNMMDTTAITQASDNQPMNVTAAGKAVASSLGNLWSDRMFFPSQFTGEWRVEVALAQNVDGTRVEPAIVRDGPRGRLMQCFQTNGQGWDPKGAVAAEAISYVMGVPRGPGTAVGVRAVKAAKAAILAYPPATGVTDTTPVAWAGDVVEITVDLLEATGSSTLAAADVTVDLTTDSATGRFDAAADGAFSASSISVTIPAGRTYVDLYYRDAAATSATPTLTASAAGLASGSRLIKIFPRTYAPHGEVAFYTAAAGWCTVPTANAQSQIAASKLSIIGVTSTIFSAIDDPVVPDEADLAAWMTAKTNNGQLDVLVIYGFVPPTIYTPNNVQQNGSIAELFIESTDGDAIIGHGDAFWYVTRTTNNGYNGVRYLMDIRDFLQSAGTINPSAVTPLGRALTPSLNNFISDRPFCIEMLLNNWLVEAVAAGGISGGRLAADPVCLRDGDRGRVIPVMLRNDDGLPKGAVAADIIASLYGVDVASPNKIAIAGRSVGGAMEPLKFTVEVQGFTGSPGRVPVDTTIALTSDAANGKFDLAYAGAYDGSVTSLVIPAGSYSATFYYKDSAGGAQTLTASTAGVTAGTLAINVFPRTFKPAGQVAIYTGAQWWLDGGKAEADVHASACAARLAPSGIPTTIFANESDQPTLAAWMSAMTNNGQADVLVLYGVLPRSIYPSSLAQTDGTLAELFIESADGDTIINSGDWMFYCDYDALGGRYENQAAGLQSMMDNTAIGMGADNTPLSLTVDGAAIAPTLPAAGFYTDRPFFPAQFAGEWYVEAALGQYGNGDRVEPAIVRDGNRGRLVAVLQSMNSPDPKGVVQAEIIAYLMGIDLVPAKLGLSHEGGAVIAITGDPMRLTVSVLDAAGYETPAASDVTVNLASSAGTGTFDTARNGAFDGSVTSVTIPEGAMSATVFYLDSAAGLAALTATDAGGAGLTAAQLDVNVLQTPFHREGQVVIYTGQVGWIDKAAADAQAQICVNKLKAAGIPVTWYRGVDIVAEEAAIAAWMTAATNNKRVDVLNLYGHFPKTIYPVDESGAPPIWNVQPDGSIAELFIESTDGDMIINHSDWIFYVTQPCCNGEQGLQNMMDMVGAPGFTLWGDDTPMYVSADGQEIAPSLVNFWSDRAIRIPTLAGEWFVEAALATDAFGSRADPIIMRDGNRGRVAIAHQAASQNDPKGAVGAEMITWVMDKIVVDYEAPNAVITATPPGGPSPLTTTLSAAASTDNGEIWAYAWLFEDGTMEWGEDAVEKVRTYTGLGTYEVTLFVIDTLGNIGATTATITVDTGPVAALTASPLEGRAPLAVTFSGASSTDDYSIVRYEWDFGDGETGEGVEIVHTYAEGNYTATLTVFDNFGSTDSASVTIAVGPAGTPVYTGDAQNSGAVDIADAICILGHLFGPLNDECKNPKCLANLDTNNDDAVDIADAVRVLAFLFSNADMLAPDNTQILAGQDGCKLYPDVVLPCEEPCTP